MTDIHFVLIHCFVWAASKTACYLCPLNNWILSLTITCTVAQHHLQFSNFQLMCYAQILILTIILAKIT